VVGSTGAAASGKATLGIWITIRSSPP